MSTRIGRCSCSWLYKAWHLHISSWHQSRQMRYLFKLHNRLRSPGRVQRKNVERRIYLRLFLDISSSRNDLNAQKSLTLNPSHECWKKIMRQATFFHKMKMKWQCKYKLRLTSGATSSTFSVLLTAQSTSKSTPAVW